MRLYKHGCGVKVFCFSLANHTSSNLKRFSSSKLDKFRLRLVVPLEVCIFYFVISMVYKGVDNGKLWSIC